MTKIGTHRLAAAAVTVISLLAAIPASAKDYLLTSVKPNVLVLVDPAARKVVKSYALKAVGGISAIAPSPDGKVAYVTTNHWGSVIGVDLDSGKEVFHADLANQGGDSFDATAGKETKRVINTFALELTPDGKELFVMESPVVLGRSEYKVQDTRIAVYRTDAGLSAQPARLLPVPRRTTELLFSDDGKKLYCVSWDLYELDPQDGKILKTTKLLNWDRKDATPPDVFGVWSQYEQAHVFVNPYFTTIPDPEGKKPPVAKTGMLTLDLKTGDVKMADFEDTSVVIFSSAVNPVRRNEAYSVYSTLSKNDVVADKLIKRITLPHTYYTVNVSSDGREIYLGGTMDDIAVYDSQTLKRIGEIRMPGGADQSITWVRVIHR